MRLLLFVCLIACGGKSNPPPANTAKPAPATQADERPYLHDCSDTGKRCDLDECVKWKVAHKEQEQMATDECMQDCNCGE